MNNAFNKSVYYGYLIQGNLIEAIQYTQQYSETSELFQRYVALFEKEQYLAYQVDDFLNGILTIYQQYYRDVFYLNIGAQKAAENAAARFASFFGIDYVHNDLGTLEDTLIAEAFTTRGYQFLGGRTAGYYGPYIWKTTEVKTFSVELPNGIQNYTVKFLSDFLSRSWLNYLSFGAVGTGGWTDNDGIINCVKDSYDLQSESFAVSLLKHESQHAMDLTAYPNMSSEDLEYRAKLVELIYSKERNLLEQFSQEADNSQNQNGHSLAASRIIAEFSNKENTDFTNTKEIPIERIQVIAKMLLTRSDEEIKIKYRK